MIAVPCGHCSECIHNKQLSIVQRLQMESLDNYLFFATLTYNNDMIPSLLVSSGYIIKYADWRDLQLTFKRLRAKNSFGRPFRYFAVSERGKKGRPHFHCIFLLPKVTVENLSRFLDYGFTEIDNEYTPLNLEKVMYDSLLSEWKRKVGGSKRNPIYKPLCTYAEKVVFGKRYRNYDLHFVVPSLNDNGADVAFYVTKYLLKRSDADTRLQQALRLNLPPDEYEDVWKVVRSRIDSSLFLGLSPSNGLVSPRIQEYISKCVSESKDFPQFFDYNGKSFPLSRYYKKLPFLFSLDDALRLNNSPDNVKSYSQIIKQVKDYEKQIALVSDRGDVDNYLYLFD